MSGDKSSRSIFVGNIPYEATEEQLRDIFVQAGPITTFRLVYDRETGKPKGYGFCEYQDAETAQSAIRNLSNVEINGRNLRIGFASGEQTHQAIDSFQSYIQPDTERIHGEPIEPERAPEAISRAVASLPPEQMFELMKQMKVCIQNNPNEARNMLLQNPQLAYALLQAQIIMKIVDPQVAMSLLHRPRETTVAPLQAPGQSGPVNAPPGPPAMNPYAPAPPSMISQQPMSIPSAAPVVPPAPAPGPTNGNLPPTIPQPPPAPVPSTGPPAQATQPPRLVDPRMMRGGNAPPPPQAAPSTAAPAPVPPALPGGIQLPAAGAPGAEQERNQLIMQVLSLRPEQIEMLPPDQRQSILLLKEQINKGMTNF